MSTHIDDFIGRHREEFDDESPSPEIWNRISEGLKAGAPPATVTTRGAATVRPIFSRRWLYAAAAVLIAALGTWLYVARRPSVTPADGLASQQRKIAEPARTDSGTKTADSPSVRAPQLAATHPAPVPRHASGLKEPAPLSAADAAAEEMYHYTRLIELKHEELKSLQKDEPLLYKKFAGDVNKLDSVYQSLKTQLPDDSNREQVIEAMIANLQLQIGLLNKQLSIIKQIKHSKKKAYEKAYQSV